MKEPSKKAAQQIHTRKKSLPSPFITSPQEKMLINPKLGCFSVDAESQPSHWPLNVAYYPAVGKGPAKKKELS